MPILKNKTQNNFTIISNNILKDKELKMIDRGVFCTLCSFPDDWSFSIEGLVKIVQDGETAIRNSIKRLEESGYIKRSYERDRRGKFADVLEIYAEKQVAKSSPSEVVHDGLSTVENPRREIHDGLSTVEKQGQYNTTNNKLNINNEDIKINHSDERMNERLEAIRKSTRRRIDYDRLAAELNDEEIKYVDMMVDIIAESMVGIDGDKKIKLDGCYPDRKDVMLRLLNYRYSEVLTVAKNMHRRKGEDINDINAYLLKALDVELSKNRSDLDSVREVFNNGGI